MSNARHYRDRETVLQEVRRGDLCAILVEGEEQGSDAALLKFILREVTTEAIFFGRDGRSGVIVDLQALVPEMPTDRVFAIVDRDFENQQVVEQCFDPNFQGHVFVWRYFTIENYLLQSSWICETVQRLLWQNPNQTIPAEFQNEESIRRLLYELAKQFAPAVAGTVISI